MNNLQDLAEIREKMRKEVALRTGEDAASKYDKQVLVCGGTGCTSSGSMKVIEKLESELSANGLTDKIQVVKTGCFGLCALGPIMIVYPEGTFYSKVNVDEIPRIVKEHFMEGNPVQEFLHQETEVARKELIRRDCIRLIPLAPGTTIKTNTNGCFICPIGKSGAIKPERSNGSTCS